MSPRFSCLVTFSLLAAANVFLSAESARGAVVPSFPLVAPAHWQTQAALSTYQEWAADPIDKIDGIPNVDFQDAGAGLTPPTLAVSNGGFIAGSGGLYSFSTNYAITAAISNHTAGVPAGAGTYVILQTFASINIGTVLGINFTDSVNALLANVQHLRSDTYGFQSNFASPFGLVDVQATIDEFWIPDFAGDFKAVVTESVHSSFMGLRLDSLVTLPAAGGGAPFGVTPVPEPATLAVLGCGMLLMGMRRARSVR